MAVLALALSSTGVRASERLISAELEEVLVEMGATAYMVGTCEHYASRAEADAFVGGLSNPDQKPGVSDFDRWVGPIMMQSYAEGRRDRGKYDLNPAACQKLLDRQGELLRKAGEAFSSG